MREAVIHAIVMIFCFGTILQADEKAEPFRDKEMWLYEHSGPRPWSDGKNRIDGPRIREVVSVEGSGSLKQWVIKEKWNDADEGANLLYYDAERKLHKQEEIGRNFTIRFEPAIPDLGVLNPHEEMRYEIKAVMGDGGQGQSHPLVITAKRMADETVTVPAGEFKDCVKVESEHVITFETETGNIQPKLKLIIWFHPDANGVVKEMWDFMPVRFGNTERPGYQCVSELKMHTVEK